MSKCNARHKGEHSPCLVKDAEWHECRLEKEHATAHMCKCGHIWRSPLNPISASERHMMSMLHKDITKQKETI